MDLEKLYSKLDKMDDKLDSYMVSQEKRVSTLEEKVSGLTGSIKVGLTFILSTAGAIFVYIFKTVFTSNQA
jgi:hypothetical protein